LGWLDDKADYQWSCPRSGRHRWTFSTRGEQQSGSFTTPKCFISKRRARRLIRRAIYADAGEEGYRIARLAIDYCRYGRSGSWNRRRWLCDLRVELVYQGRRGTLCGWGRVVKMGRRTPASFSADRYSC
jgi:hypothetical protein